MSLSHALTTMFTVSALGLGDPQVARALLTTSTAFKKHAQRMAPAQQVSKAARALAVIDTYVAVEEELEGRGKSHRPPGEDMCVQLER